MMGARRPAETPTRSPTTTYPSSTLQELDARKERLVGDCLLTSSFLSYTGCFTYTYRHAMVYDLWQSDARTRDIPVTAPFK